MAYDISLERFPGEVASYRRRTLGKRRFLRRLFDAFIASRQRHADREIARYLEVRRDRASKDAYGLIGTHDSPVVKNLFIK